MLRESKEYFSKWYMLNKKKLSEKRRQKYRESVDYRKRALLNARIKWKLKKLLEHFKDGEILIHPLELLKLRGVYTKKVIVMPQIQRYKRGHKIPIRFYLILLGVKMAGIHRLTLDEWKELISTFESKRDLTAKEVCDYVKERKARHSYRG